MGETRRDDEGRPRDDEGRPRCECAAPGSRSIVMECGCSSPCRVKFTK